jgi:hypothetical protein
MDQHNGHFKDDKHARTMVRGATCFHAIIGKRFVARGFKTATSF